MLRRVMWELMHPDIATGYILLLDAGERDRLHRMLDEPGIDLAIELWAGPGAFERLLEASICW